MSMCENDIFSLSFVGERFFIVVSPSIFQLSCVILFCRNQNKRKLKVHMLMPKKLSCHLK